MAMIYQRSVVVAGMAHKAHVPSICVLDGSVGGNLFSFARVFGRIPDIELPPAERKLPGGGMLEEEVEQMFKNLQEVLAAAGANMNNICSVTVFGAPGIDKEAVDKVWKRLYRTRECCPSRNWQTENLADGCRVAILGFGVVMPKRQNRRLK